MSWASRRSGDKKRRIGPLAVALGLISCAGALAIGLFGYTESVRHTEDHLRRIFLDKARMLAVYAASRSGDSEVELLEGIRRMWAAASQRSPDEYLCIVDRRSELILHTAAPETVGSYAGGNRLLDTASGGPQCLRELPAKSSDYVGGYISSAGEEQIAAFVVVPSRGWVLGIHRSRTALRAEVLSGIIHLTVGLFVVCGILMPLSLLLIYRTARLAVRKRLEAEEVLRASHERFKTVMDSFDALVYVADMKTREILYINRYGRKIWGDIVGETCWEKLQSGQIGPCSFCTNDQLVDTEGVPTGVHVWQFRNTVNNRWYECRDQAIRWTDGRLVRMEMATDVTARREAEQVLQEREEELRQLLADLPIGVVIVDYETHRIIDVNPLAASIIGAPKQEIVGNICHRFICPAQEGRCPITDLGQPLHTGERILITAAGERLPILKSVAPVTMGGRRYLLEGFLDITERKKAEDTILTQNRFLNNVLESLTHPFYVIDAVNFRVKMANSAATSGGPADALTCHKLTHHSDTPCNSAQHPCPIDVVRRERKPVTLEHVHFTREGRPRHVEVHAYPIFDDKGDVSEIIEYSLDITERKAFEQKQEVNIGLATRLLSLVNADCPRHIELDAERVLFIEVLSIPCHAAGGDHCLVRTLPAAGPNGGSRTVLSLKDQSGHEVNCVLRSIITDLMHNAILLRHPGFSLQESLSRLNEEACRSGLFREEDFLTAVSVEIGHDSLTMRYSCCGHPPFLLVRDTEVRLVPSEDGAGKNLPVGIVPGVEYTAAPLQLEPGDRLIFYTDGLLDMPIRNQQRRITPDELKAFVESILKEHPDLCVSDLVRIVLADIARESNEEVIPHETNTSQDDVTIVGVEIESQAVFSEARIVPQDLDHLNEAVTALCERISEEWRPFGLDDSDTRLHTVLEESVFNAWTHGHARNAERPITVRWRRRNDFHIEVIDHGEGFDASELADPTALKNRLNESGRGIFMINLAADSARWEDHGTRLVTAIKRNESPREREHARQIRKLMRLWEPSR